MGQCERCVLLGGLCCVWPAATDAVWHVDTSHAAATLLSQVRSGSAEAGEEHVIGRHRAASTVSLSQGPVLTHAEWNTNFYSSEFLVKIACREEVTGLSRACHEQVTVLSPRRRKEVTNLSRGNTFSRPSRQVEMVSRARQEVVSYNRCNVNWPHASTNQMGTFRSRHKIARKL